MAKQEKVIIAMGSNNDAVNHIDAGKMHLRSLLGAVVFSSEKWTAPLKFGSEKFLNCLAVAQTGHSPRLLEQALKNIERKCGDTRRERNAGIVRLDLDLLLVGDKKMHEADWNRPYIKELMKEIINPEQLT